MTSRGIHGARATVTLTLGLVVALSGSVAFADTQASTTTAATTAAATTVAATTPAATTVSTVAATTASTESATTSAVTGVSATAPATTQAATPATQPAQVALTTQATSELKDGTYYLVSSIGKNLVLDVASGVFADASNVQVWTSNSSAAQRWTVVVKDGLATIYAGSAQGSYVLDLSRGQASLGSNVQIYGSNGSKAQQWVIAKSNSFDQDGTYVIESAVDTSYVLDITSGSTTAGTNVQVWTSNDTSAQKWSLVEVPTPLASQERTVADGEYSFVWGASKLQLSTAGTAATVATADGSASQDYQVTFDANSGHYTIQDLYSKAYLAEGPAFNGASAEVYTTTADTTTAWNIVKSGNGYVLQNVAWGLQLQASSATAGASVSAVKTASDVWTLAEPSLKWTAAGIAAFAKQQYAAGNTLKDGSYILSSSLSSRTVLDMMYASKDSGGNAWVYGSNMTAAQQWQVTTDSSTGFSVIKNVGSGLVLDAASGKNVPGTNLQQWASNGTPAQQWLALKNGDGTYTFYSALGNAQVVDIAGGSTADGTNVQTWTSNGTGAQRWNAYSTSGTPYTQKSEVIANGDYTVSNVVSGLVVDVPGASRSAGMNLQLYSSNGTPAQAYRITQDASGYYTIQSLVSGLFLQIRNGDIIPGGLIEQSSLTGGTPTSNQLWAVVKSGSSVEFVNVATSLVLSPSGLSSSSALVSASSASSSSQWALTPYVASVSEGCYTLSSGLGNSLVLDVDSASLHNGANVQVWTSNESQAQKWYVRPVTVNGKTSYTLQNVSSGLYLSASSAAASNTTNVVQATNSSLSNWNLSYAINQGYVLTNAVSGLALDVTGAAAVAGTNVWEYQTNGSAAQTWVFSGTSMLIPGFYQFASADNVDQRIDIAGGTEGNGVNAQTWASNGSAAQVFEVTINDNGTYSIKTCTNARSAYALDVLNGVGADGSNVQQYGYNGSTAQQWTFTMDANGIVAKSALGSFALGRAGAGTGSGTNVVLSAAGAAGTSWHMIQAAKPASYYSAVTQHLDNYIAWVTNHALDDYYGFDEGTRFGPRDFDCSGFVITGLTECGFETYGAYNTFNLASELGKAGWQVMSAWDMGINAGDWAYGALQPGDIIVNQANHAATYIGNGQICAARINELIEGTGGQPGDQLGQYGPYNGEIAVYAYSPYTSDDPPAFGWDYVIRATENTVLMW